MERQLLFFDIDGTLLSEKTHQVPQSAIDALKQAQANGHLIFINTGRPYASLGKEIKAIPHDGLICGCGTYIEYHQQLLLHQTIDDQTVSMIIKQLKQCHVYGLLEGKEGVYYDPCNTHPHVKKIQEGYFNQGLDTSKTWDDTNIHFDKMTIWHNEQSDFNTFLKAMMPKFEFIERANDFGEFVPHGYSKATAIQYLMNHFDIPLEHTYSFGDSTNDLAMLCFTGHSIGMKNSHPEVLNKVEFITKDVDDDGIAYALKHFHLI